MVKKKEVAPAPKIAGDPPGIVVLDRLAPPLPPLIAAFVWGGPAAPPPTLPFGRWKVAAA